MRTASKIQRVLGIFLAFFLAICLRIWHLGVIQREDRLLEAEKPQQRTFLERADRGTIFDRFHIPLAVNRISYNAAIYYAQITEIPSRAWVKGPDGKQIKIYPRKEYIRNLAGVLAKTLELEPERIEDLIHSKAALFPHVPYIIKASLSEKEHYQLRMLEKDWPGIYAEIAQTRYYPQGKTGCNIIGTMGAISQKEYSAIAQEISELQAMRDFQELDQIDRLSELKEKAYKINDLIGKTGIESEYEEELRGFFGKKTFEVDQKGRFIRELSHKKAIPGKEIVLSISSELQAFGEQLLAQDERTRDGRSRGYDPADKRRKIQKQPWIKGGAIVALDPTTGEVLAMASHPRFDPNDFIYKASSVFSLGKTKQINRWLENEALIGDLWDGIDVLAREDINLTRDETQRVSWEFFLETILPKDKPIFKFFDKMNVRQAVQLQEDYEAKLYFESIGQLVPNEIKERIAQIQLPPEDLLFAVDLCRVAVYAPAFTDALIDQVGQLTISEYRELCQEFLRGEETARLKEQELFHKNEFRKWREENQKEFLSLKRKEEKEKKLYARPYIEYLDKMEGELFSEYWKEKRFTRLKDLEMSEELMRTFRSFKDLNRPLLGKYRALRNWKKQQTEKDLAASFYPIGGFGFSKSYAFESAVPPGSVFKLVTAYEGLRQNKSFEMIDEYSRKGVGRTLKNALYPRFYKGGRLPKSAARNMGKIDLVTALERSSNPYFAILAGDYYEDPNDLVRAAKLFGYGDQTGIDLPREKRGNVPSDLKINRTGLYSASIGQHTFLTTPLQTANMLVPIANGGKLLKPNIVQKISGSTPDRHPLGVFDASFYFAQEELEAIGITYPLFTSMQSSFEQSRETRCGTKIKRFIPMEKSVREPLLKGMDRVVSGVNGSARPNSIKALLKNPHLMGKYKKLQHQLVGKTGTAEIVCRLSKNPSSKPQIYKYTWFGSIAFKDEEQQQPELVVVVFLRYGDSGKEAAPLAAEMVHKWREIKEAHGVL